MTNISVTDFNNWKVDPVTVAFINTIKVRIEEAKDFLSYNAGIDSASDSYFRGFIQGQREILDVSFSDVDEVQ